MKTLNALKVKIMVRAFRIRIKNGDDFADIVADYPALTVEDVEVIRDALNACSHMEKQLDSLISLHSNACEETR